MAKGNNNAPQSTVSIGSGGCLAAGCSKKTERAEFCNEHFRWFKAGLITARGERAKDFDKKIRTAARLVAEI